MSLHFVGRHEIRPGLDRLAVSPVRARFPRRPRIIFEGVAQASDSAPGRESDSLLPNAVQRDAVVATLDAIPMAAVAHTLDYRLIAVNGDCAALLKVSSDQVAGRSVKDFIPVSDRQTALETARTVALLSSTSIRPASALRRLIDGAGQELTCWMHVGLATIGGYQCFLICLDLVNPVLSDAHRWRHRAEYDELTGLARRGTLLAQLAQWITARRLVMLAFLDIDNFKAINDTHGHAAGDQVLTTIARRLEQHAPKGCIVSRLAGDEFVLAHTVTARPDAADFADLLAAAEIGLRSIGPLCVSEPVAWGDNLLVLSISMGVTTSRAGEDPGRLLSRADKKMYAQKAAARRGGKVVTVATDDG